MTFTRTFCLISFLLFPAALFAQSGIISTGRYEQWARANVGVPGGIPSGTWTQSGSTISAYGTSGSPGAVSTINNALTAACGTNKYVLLGAGSFFLDGPPVIKCSGEELRGAGPSTIINTVNPSECVQTSQDIQICGNQAPPFLNPNDCDAFPSVVTCPGNAYAFSWTGGFSQGATSLTLTSVGSGGINNGEIITLDQANVTTALTGLIACSIGPGTCTQQGNSYAGRDIGGIQWNQQQHVRVTAGCASTCTGSGPFTVTITPGLYMANWNTTAGKGGYFVKPISNAGIRNMTIDNSVGVAGSNIGLDNCDGCWVVNVTSLHGNRNHIWAGEVTHSEIRDSYFYATVNGLIESYGIEMFDSSDNLVENNIFQQIASPNIGAGADEGNVTGYNFSIDNYYTGSSGNFMQQVYVAHDAGNNFNLYEGNQFNALSADNIHGTSGLDTIFRNWLNGRDFNTAGSPPYQPTQQTYPIDLDALNRGYNIIGNVLGTPGYHVNYQYRGGIDASPGGGPCDLVIYEIGWSSSICTNFGGLPADATTTNSLMRWGNYDVANAAVRWDATESSPSAFSFIPANTTPGSHALPSSFYYGSKPAFFGSATWPTNGPDVTGGSGPGGFSGNNPAATCYFGPMHGSTNGLGGPFTFDAGAAVCNYGSGGGGGSPIASLSTTSFSFAPLAPGASSSTTITLTNTGTVGLIMSSTVLSGSSLYTITSNTCTGTIGVSAMCTTTVHFAPLVFGLSGATLTYTNNASPTTQAVTFKGNAVVSSPGAPVVNITNF